MTFPSTPPPLGISARASVRRWIDADTVEVIVEIPARVRLLDCWAHEKGTPDGEVAAQFVSSKWPVGTPIQIHVPSEEAKNLGSVFTFGRLLGWLWERDAERDSTPSINEQIVNRGYATREK